MGTRHLIAVQLDGIYRIAQYGQWDGYPSGQGKTVLDFLRPLMAEGAESDLEDFKTKLRACQYMTDEDIDQFNQTEVARFPEDWQKRFPSLTRDTGAHILTVVRDNPDGSVPLVDSLNFAADSLMCEWAYVIDFDLGVLAVYQGFNKTPLLPSERFAHLGRVEPESEYYPVRIVASFPLHNLPTQEVFESTLDPQETES